MEKLTRQEEEAMQVIWKYGEGNIKAFIANMETPVVYTTLASTIKKLEKKGYLASRLVGNVNLYRPAISEDAYKKEFVGDVVKDYFSDSYKEMVSFFIHEKKISPEDLKDIIHLIETNGTSTTK